MPRHLTAEQAPVQTSSWYIVGGLALIVAQAVLIVEIVWLRAKRTKAQNALVKSQELFSKAFRQSPLSITVLSTKDGRYIDVNETFERITGWSRDDVIGRTAFDIGLPPDPEASLETGRLLLSSYMVRNLEVKTRTKNGELRTGLASAEWIELNGEQCVIVVTADITQLKRAEAVLRESEQRFRLVANTAPVMIWMAGVDKRCTYFNGRWLEFSGRSLEEQLGNSRGEAVHPEDLSQFLDTYTHAFNQRESFQIQYRLRRSDGEYRWVIDSGVPRFDADGSFAGYIGSAIDITERKLAEETLPMVSRKLIEAHEEERARIARELHDDVSQRLCLLQVRLGNLKSSETSPVELRHGIEHAMQEVSNLATDVQGLSHRLHSSNLKFLGLAKAAAAYCNEVADQHKVQIDFHEENMPSDLSPEISLSIFRVLQEALRNAIKHSGSQRFEVLLNHTSNEIRLTVHDPGKGFDAAEAIKGRGLGLTSMKERVALVGGELSIESQPQNGTTVYVRVPVPPTVKSAHLTG